MVLDFNNDVKISCPLWFITMLIGDFSVVLGLLEDKCGLQWQKIHNTAAGLQKYYV